MNKLPEPKNVEAGPRDPRGFAYRLVVTYPVVIGHIFGGNNSTAFIEVQYHETSDGKKVWKAHAYDNPHYERWTANVFPDKRSEGLRSYAEAGSPCALLIALGIDPLIALPVANDILKAGLRATGKSQFTFESHAREFTDPPAVEPTITITVGGRSASGKSSVALLIAETLRLHGLQVALVDDNGLGMVDERAGAIEQRMHDVIGMLRKDNKSVKVQSRCYPRAPQV